MAGWSCWDLGAHYGLYSVGLARRVGPTGHVAAFEPNPVSYRRLEDHRRLNRLPWLLTFPAAASEHSGRADLYTYGDLHGTTTHLPYEDERPGEATEPLAVETVRLDDLVAAGTLNPPDLIKIDVEGHAHRAVAGMAATLRRKPPTLLVAFHSAPEVEGVRQILLPLGYSATVIGAPPADEASWIGRDFLFTPAT
jgi:FkbM family methyltransferase